MASQGQIAACTCIKVKYTCNQCGAARCHLEGAVSANCVIHASEVGSRHKILPCGVCIYTGKLKI